MLSPRCSPGLLKHRYTIDMSLSQRLCLAYAALFFFVAVMGYIPPFVDEKGLLFSLFALDLYDNLLHAFSGLWALVAALISERQALTYLKLFGIIYGFDGVVGLFVGNAFLDFGIFVQGIADNTFIENFWLNIPHILIGGIAAAAGFMLEKRAR